MNLGNSADQPFEEYEQRTPILDDQVLISGSIQVGAADGVDVPDVGRKPALLFRFTDPHGFLYPAVLLVLDDDQAAKLPELVAAAVNLARKAAR